MNRIYRSLWNASLGSWVAVPETARSGGGGSGAQVVGAIAAKAPALRWHAVATAVALAWGLVGATPDAMAACVAVSPGAGGTVECSGNTVAGYNSALNNLTVNVLNGATVSSSSGAAINLTGNNARFTNFGTVGPVLLPTLVNFTSAVVVGNPNNSNVNITNNGTARAIGDTQSGSLMDLTGMAYEVKNGGNGTTTFTNNGIIDAAPLITAGGLLAVDIPVVAIYNPGAGAGNRVDFTNNLGASITGRIAFQGSVAGNTFINAGTLSGSLSMGAGGAGGNKFIAVTGSIVQKGLGVGTTLGVTGRPNLQFAPTGIVDGGLNGNNTLILQNVASAGDPGSGSGGSGSVSSGTYKNFPNLKVNSGTWAVLGPLLSGMANPNVELNGGIVNVNDASVFGTATVIGNGGTLRSLDPSLNLANAFTLNNNGLIIDGTSQLTLNGQLSGSGALTKSGTNTLVLNSAANNYSGGTILQGGTLSVGSASALGSGGLSVTGASTLEAIQAMNLGTGIDLGAALNVGGTNALTLSGNITGTGSLNKSSINDVTLSGTNNFSGGVNIAAGRLFLGNAGALGSGPLSVSGATAVLDSASAQTLANAVALNSGTLTLAGSNNLTLNGLISGSGSLTKNGASTLTLRGANDFTGGLSLNAGTLIVGSNTALGSGRLLVGGSSVALDSDTAVRLNNNISISGNQRLTLAGSNALTLSGTITGAGGLDKNGAADLTLSGASNFTGGVQLNAGRLIIGSNGAFGSAAFSAAAGTTLDTNAARIVSNAGTLGGNVMVAGSNDLTLSGDISGAGGLTKNGAATLTLGGNNVFLGGVALNAGTLLVGQTSAMGLGSLTTAAGTTLGGSVNATVNNQVNINGDLTLDGPGNLSLGGVISGTGNLIKNGNTAVQLAGANTFQGDTQLNAGVLFLGNDNALGQGQLLAAGGTLDTFSARSVANRITLDGAMAIGGNGAWALQGVIDGGGSLTKNGIANLSLTGVNTYTGGTTLNAGSITLGNAGALGTGDVSVGGVASLMGSAPLILGNKVHLSSALTLPGNSDLTLGGVIDGFGSLTKSGTGALTLSGSNVYSGGTSLASGTLIVASNTALGSGTLVAGNGTWLDSGAAVSLANNVNIGAGGLNVLGSHDLTLNGVIAGSGGLNKNGAATLTLAGANTYEGDTLVNAGALLVDGHVDGGVIANTGGTLGGKGSIAGDVTIASGATLSPGHDGAGTLTVDGNLTLQGNSTTRFALGQAGVVGGASNGLVSVGSDLNLGGALIANAASAGWYRLFNYDGDLSGSFASTRVDSTQSGFTPTSHRVDASTAGQINLSVVGAGQSLRFWNGSQISGTGSVAGGAGTWSAFGTNWTDSSGAATEGWNGSVAVFGGSAGGTVTVEGTQSFDTLQFSTNGYNLVAGSNGKLALSPATGTQGTINTNAGISAAIAASIVDGSGTSLSKVGGGTLTLSGSNSYSGGTTVAQGTLVAASNNALGSGAVTVDNATGQNATLRINSGVTLANNVTLTHGGALINAGTLAGNLLLDPSSANHVSLEAGSRVQGNLALGSNVGSTLTLDASANAVWRYSQAVGGSTTLAGGLIKSGAGTWVLDRDLTPGTTLIAGGALQVGDGAAAGSLGAGSVTNNGTLIINRSDAITLANTISGSGTLMQNGVGTTTLTGVNTYSGGTLIARGRLVASAGSLGSGGIANNAALELNQATNATLTQTISGTGSLVKTGAGSLTLAGANTSTGTTTINGGTLIASVGNLASGAITNNATLQLNQASNATLAQAIGGTGGLVKAGAGSLTLAGVNTYTGSTTINAGTLIASVGNLGSGAISNNAALELNQASDATLAQAINGTGTLIKSGAGSLTLAGINTSTGGTTINAGKLIASATNLGSGAISNNAALELNQASDATLAQAISGTGSLTKTGAGSLTLAGLNTSTGGTVINAGKLIASAANLGSGAISNNAALELNQAVDATLAQAISGSGSMTKTGSGRLTLTGNSSAFAGSTMLNAGALQLDAGAALGGTLAVASGASLSGVGTVGSTTLANGGIVSPGSTDASGHAYGTLNVNGDLSFQTGSLYQVHADPESSASDRIAVTGTASLAGGVLHVGPEAGFQVARTYTILTANRVNGTFDSVASNYAYLDPKLQYSASDVALLLQRKLVPVNPGTPGTPSDPGTRPIAFADLAQTSNQVAVANGVESMPSTSALYRFVETLPAGAPPSVFQSLSGESHASAQASMRTGAAMFGASSLGHLHGNLTANLRPGAPVAQSGGALPASAMPSSSALPMWAEVVGHWQSYAGDGNAARLKQDTTGLFLGGDAEVAGSGWRLGGSLGYTEAKARVSDRSSKATVDSYSAAIYGGKSFGLGSGNLNVMGGVGYTWHDIASERQVNALDQTLKADYHASTAQVFAEVGYALGQNAKMGIEPFAGISLGQQRTRGFKENGGFAALRGNSSSDDLASSTLGVRAHSDFNLGSTAGRLRGMVGWRHAFGDVSSVSTMAFEGGQSFTVAGVPLARNAAVVGLETELELSRNAALVVGYKGEFGSGNRDDSAQVRVRWAF